MSGKKIESILSLIEVIENNLKTTKNLLQSLVQEKGIKLDQPSNYSSNVSLVGSSSKSYEENNALEVTEGYFDGENMIGDNGQIYPVPQNYASKTQLVIGDRMKWILTSTREIFKLIQPAPRKRVTGTFSIEGDNYIVLVDGQTNPVKILKASATYAMKNLGLGINSEVAIYIPQDATASWGAFISVVKNGQKIDEEKQRSEQKIRAVTSELDSLDEFELNDNSKITPSKQDTISQKEKAEDFF
jgi:hypothetical protein